MALCDYHLSTTQPQGLLNNVLVELARKVILTNIEVVNSKLDYNLLLHSSYMYSMKLNDSLVFSIMIFSHRGNIIKNEHLTYCDRKSLTYLNNDLLMIDNSLTRMTLPRYLNIIPGNFCDATMIMIYEALAPLPPKL